MFLVLNTEKKKKKISRKKTKYRVLAKKFIKEFQYFCRLGELGTRRNAMSYQTTLWWMKRAGICDNHRVTFRDVEVHFINNLKRGYNLKILGFIRFLKSLCEDRGLRMSIVLDQMLNCREITGMTGRKPAKRSRLIYTTKNLMNTEKNQTENKAWETGKKLEQKCVFNSESSVVPCEKNSYRRERIRSASNALLYSKDYPTDLGLLTKWINPSVETDPLRNKDDVKSSEKIYSNKNFSFDAELLKSMKKHKSIPKDIPKELCALKSPCEIQGNLFKFTDKADEFISEEENYEYIESDSSCDKPCQSSEEIDQSSQHAEKFEVKKNASPLKCDNSKTLTATKKDLQLDPKQTGDTSQFGNSTDTVFQTHKCISVELIKLLNDELKNSSTFKKDQDISGIFEDNESLNVSENSFIHTNKNDKFSNDKCDTEKNGDLFPENREKTDTLESKKHEMNSPRFEKISVDQKTETRHSQKIKNSIISSVGKKSAIVKNGKLSPAVKINSTNNNFLKNRIKKPPASDIMKNSSLLASQKEQKNISAPKNDALHNKNLKNIQEITLSSSCNKNKAFKSNGKLSITKNSNNSNKVEDSESQDKNKNQDNENKKKMACNKVPWNSGVIKFKLTQSNNNISPNYKKIATSDNSIRNGKNVSQKNDQRLSQKHKLPESKNLKDVRESEISSYRTKNNKTFPNQDVKSSNNSKETGTTNSLSKNEGKIQRSNIRKPIESCNEVISLNNLEKVGKSNCSAKMEEKVKHCKTHEQNALINGLNIRKQIIKSQGDVKRKDISNRRGSPLDAKKSFTNMYKTKSISPKNTNTVEKESFSTVSLENAEKSKMLEEENPSVMLSKNKEEAKHSSVIRPEDSKNGNVKEENSFSPKDTKDSKMLQEKSSLIILLKSPEETELIEVEHNPVILQANSNKAKILEEGPKYTENLKLLEEESFLIAPSENTGNRKFFKKESLRTVSPKYTEVELMEEHRSPVTPRENTGIREKEFSPVISPKVIEDAKMSKEESSLFTAQEHTINKNTLEEESHPVMMTNNTEEEEMTEEAFFPVIPSKNSKNAKMPKEESVPIISSKYSGNANMPEEKCFEVIPKNIRKKKKFEEKSPPVISSKNTKCSQMLEENSSLKEDRNEYPPKESQKKINKCQTFTNLPISQAQKNSKKGIFESKNSKLSQNKISKEVIRKTQAFFDKRSTSSVNRCKISKNIDIACIKKVQQRHSADITKVTCGNNQDKTA